MQFNAYFPLLNHAEELDNDIKQTEPPTDKTLTKEISKAKKIAIEVEDKEALNNLDGLESQLENEKGSADGRLKILDGLRKELLKLEVIEKSEEWSKIEQDLKNSFYELDDLIDKIKANSDDENLNMEKIEAHVMEYRNRVEQIIKEKDNSEAKKLIQEIGQMDFNIRNAVTGNALDVQLLSHFNESFNSFHWTNANKARQLLNQGMQMATAGETAGIRQILVQLIGLLPDNEKPKDTLG
jgi:molecular chaperone DnaK